MGGMKPTVREFLRLFVIVFTWVGIESACSSKSPVHHADAVEGKHHHHQHHERFEDPELWAKTFDDPQRVEWQKPEQLVAALHLKPSARVAEVGAGTGFFLKYLSKSVPRGKVYLLDVEPKMVDYLNRRILRDGITRAAAFLSKPDQAQIPEKVDLVLFVNTYHHIEARTEYFKKLRDSLQPGGRIAIVDFKMESKIGPPASMKVEPKHAIREMEAAGFTASKSFEILPEQYFIVFQVR